MKTKVPILNLQPITSIIILILIIVYTINLFSPTYYFYLIHNYFGFIPYKITSSNILIWQKIIPTISYIFFHADFYHILINILMLLTFGSSVEKFFDKKFILFIFFLSGILGALSHCIIFSNSLLPMIGASAAISGLFGSALVVILKRKNKNLNYLIIVSIVWIGLSTFLGIFDINISFETKEIAWTAHIGGFISGVISTILLIKFYFKFN